MGCWWCGVPSPCLFPNNASSKERVKPWFFVTFNIIINGILKILRLSVPILAIFSNFHQFFGFFDISLLQRKERRQLVTDDVSIISISTYFKKIVQQLHKVLSILDLFFLKYELRKGAN